MRDVDADHQEVPAPQPRRLALAARAVDGHVLAYEVVVAYTQSGALALELHVLRLAAEGRVLVDAVARAEGREAFDDGVGADLAALADLHVLLDDGVRADAHVAREFRARADDCRGVYFHRF